MNLTLRKLMLISKVFDFSKFYTISLDSTEINLQGEYNNEIVKQCVKLKFTQTLDINGYIIFRRSGIKIILTN